MYTLQTYMHSYVLYVFYVNFFRATIGKRNEGHGELLCMMWMVENRK